jgi:hypothetical protein
MKVTDEMVNRFLSWRLPKDFAPDCGVSFKPINHPDALTHLWPVGTNLFTAVQVKAMLEHVLGEALPSTEQQIEYPRDNALELARSKDLAALAWKAAFGNETLKHPDQSLLAQSFLAISAELDYRDGGRERITGQKSAPSSASPSVGDTTITKLNNAVFVEQWERLCRILGIEKRSVIDVVDEVENRLARSATRATDG